MLLPEWHNRDNREGEEEKAIIPLKQQFLMPLLLGDCRCSWEVCLCPPGVHGVSAVQVHLTQSNDPARMMTLSWKTINWLSYAWSITRKSLQAGKHRYKRIIIKYQTLSFKCNLKCNPFSFESFHKEPVLTTRWITPLLSSPSPPPPLRDNYRVLLL